MEVKWYCSDCGKVNESENKGVRKVRDGQRLEKQCVHCHAEVEIEIEVNVRTRE